MIYQIFYVGATLLLIADLEDSQGVPSEKQIFAVSFLNQAALAYGVWWFRPIMIDVAHQEPWMAGKDQDYLDFENEGQRFPIHDFLI